MTTEQNDRWLEALRMASGAPSPEEITEANDLMLDVMLAAAEALKPPTIRTNLTD